MRLSVESSHARLYRKAQWHKFYAIIPKRINEHELGTGKVMRRSSYLKITWSMFKPKTWYIPKYEYCGFEEFVAAKIREDSWTTDTKCNEELTYNGQDNMFAPGSPDKVHTYKHYRRLQILQGR